MKLSSPALERNLQQHVRRELRPSPLLWRDYRQHRARWWKRNRNFRGVLGSVYILAVLFCLAVSSRRSFVLLAVVALYASGTALLRCATYCSRVVRGYDRAVLVALPVLDDDYLRHESLSFFRSWAGALAVFLAAYGIYAILYGNLRQDLGAVLVAAVLQTLSGLCIGAAVLVNSPKWNLASAVVPLYGLMIACLFLPEDAQRFLWSATLIMPAGWVAHGFAALAGNADSAEKFWLVPAFIVSAALPFALRRLRLRLVSELESPDGAFAAIFALDEEQEQAPLLNAVGSGQPLVRGVQLARELKGTVWKRLGWIERVIGVLLTDREKVVAEFMLSNELGAWSKKLRIAAVITITGTAITFISPSLPPWLFFVPMLIAALIAAPVLGGSWPGFKGSMAYDLAPPSYACFPISYGEISRVMLKTNLIRALTWAPLALVYAAALAHRSGYSLEYGSGVGLEIVLILMAVQPAIVAGHFSSGTNDTKQINVQVISFFGFGLILLIIMVTAVSMMFIVPTLLVQAVAIAVVFAMSLMGWAVYKVLFERGRIDLLFPARTQ